MNGTGLQVQLFQMLKTRLGAGVSLADEIAAVLNIGTDSAYRRIRGEKSLSVEELHLICCRYQLSMDVLLNPGNNTVSFEGRYVNADSFQFQEYLAAVGQQVAYMASFRHRELYYLCKDIPLFHHYQSKALAAFKYFFWHRTLLGSPDIGTKKICFSNYPDDVFTLGGKALAAYNQIDVHEIWNMESLNSTLRQVEFYHDTAVFQHNEDLLQVYEGLEQLFLHLEKQAELGYQFNCSDKEQRRMGNFHLYFNEIVTGDNSILAVLDNAKLAFLTHSGINFLLTRNNRFCENLHRYYQNLIRRSTLISTVSERERAAFFHELRQRIAIRKRLLQT